MTRLGKRALRAGSGPPGGGAPGLPPPAPSPIDPVAYQPPKRGNPHRAFAPEPRAARRATPRRGPSAGPGGRGLRREGRLYTGTADGKIKRVSLLNEAVEDFATRAAGRWACASIPRAASSCATRARASSPSTPRAGSPSWPPKREAVPSASRTTSTSRRTAPSTSPTRATPTARTSTSTTCWRRGPRGRLLRHDPATGQTDACSWTASTSPTAWPSRRDERLRGRGRVLPLPDHAATG